MSSHAVRLGRFHDRLAGITSQVLAHGRTPAGKSSYQLLAELARPGERVLDLGCGDGYLLELLAAAGALPLGVDRSGAELALAHRRGALAVAADAAALPVADATCSLVVSHLAFSIMEPVEPIAAEIDRVLAPGGRFACIVGGGPVATTPGAPGAPDAPDPFDHFLSLMTARFATLADPSGTRLGDPGPRLGAPRTRLGDPRASRLEGWWELFPGAAVAFTRHGLDLSAPLPTVWRFLSTTYDATLLPPASLDELGATFTAWCAAHFELSHIPLHLVVWLAVASR